MQMEKEHSYIQTEANMKGIGKKVKGKGLEYILCEMAADLAVNKRMDIDMV